MNTAGHHLVHVYINNYNTAPQFNNHKLYQLLTTYFQLQKVSDLSCQINVEKQHVINCFCSRLGFTRRQWSRESSAVARETWRWGFNDTIRWYCTRDCLLEGLDSMLLIRNRNGFQMFSTCFIRGILSLPQIY